MSTAALQDVAIDDFVCCYQELNEVCLTGIDLSDINEMVVTLQESVKAKYVPAGLEFFIRNDEVFSYYLPLGEVTTLSEYEAATEGIVKDVFTAIFNFFKRLVLGVKDFIKKLFGLKNTVTAMNESGIRQLRPVFEKYQPELSKIKASSQIPPKRDMEKVLVTLERLMRSVSQINVTDMEDQVNKILDGKSDTVTFEVNYEKAFGKNYVEDFKLVGISFEEDIPSFTSVFTDTQTDSTIGGLGYNYSELLELIKINEKQIQPLKSQMMRMSSVLEKITNNIARLKLKLSDDEENSERFKEVLENLPRTVSKLVSTFHKISGASLAYEYKMADIIKCLREDFKVYAKEV